MNRPQGPTNTGPAQSKQAKLKRARSIKESAHLIKASMSSQEASSPKSDRDLSSPQEGELGEMPMANSTAARQLPSEVSHKIKIKSM